MTLPNVIGIGAEKCGSTWLYLLLKSHPEIYMSEKRKEIDFFNRRYEEGLDWYESFFPSNRDANEFSTVGEFSPSYLYYPACAERIEKLGSVKNLLLIVRNPADQMYSYYGQAVRGLNYQKTFEDFLEENPKCLEKGLYGKHLKPFLKFYSQRQILCLIFEESVSGVQATMSKVSQFLSVDVTKFPNGLGEEKANESYIPKYRKLSYLADRARNVLLKYDQDWLINLAKTIGIQTALRGGGETKKIPSMSQKMRQKLLDYYREDIEDLESLMGISLSVWSHDSTVETSR